MSYTTLINGNAGQNHTPEFWERKGTRRFGIVLSWTGFAGGGIDAIVNLKVSNDGVNWATLKTTTITTANNGSEAIAWDIDTAFRLVKIEYLNVSVSSGTIVVTRDY